MAIASKFASPEGDLTRLVRRHVTRGRVTVSMHLEWAAEQREELVLDEAKCDHMLGQLKAYASKHGDIGHTIKSGDLLPLAGLWQSKNPEIDQETLKSMVVQGLEATLEGLNEQRSKEGQGLKLVLEGHLSQITELVGQIQNTQAMAPQKHLDQMKLRLEALLPEVGLSEDRLVQEAAHIADKLDVAEEVNRLRIHVDHVNPLMMTSPVGRKLDFMCQEFIREANTVGSKCHDATVAHLV